MRRHIDELMSTSVNGTSYRRNLIPLLKTVDLGICDEILRIIYTAWNAAPYRRADVVNQCISVNGTSYRRNLILLLKTADLGICDEILRIIYTVWNAAPYRRADVVNQSVCQRDVISTKPDTLDGDRGPLILRRSSVYPILISTRHRRVDIKSRSRQSITRRKNLIREGYTSTIELRRRSAESTPRIFRIRFRIF